MKAYIPHYTPLAERHKSIIATCNDLKLDPQIISAYDKESLLSHPKWSEENQREWNNRVQRIIPILLANANSLSSNSQIPQWATYRILKSSEISLTYKHFLCLLQIASNREPGLVFEDDILTKPTSKLNLTRALDLLGSEADYIDLGGGCELPPYASDAALETGGIFIKTNPPRSRTTAAYAITPEAALKVASSLFPCIFPLDWSFQYIFLEKGLRVLWTQPSCLLHGSQNSMPSSIQ